MIDFALRKGGIVMSDSKVSRRELLVQGSAAALGMAFLHPSFGAQIKTSGQGEQIIPFLD